MIPWIRRALQAATLALLVVAPVLGIWGVSATTMYPPNDMTRRYSAPGTWLSDFMRSMFGSPPEWITDAVVGGTWSIRILGVEFTDPIGIGHLLFAGQAPPGAMLFGALLVVAVHVLLGRFFCGYLCPYGTLSRLVSRARPFLLRHNLVLQWELPTSIRYYVLGAVVVLPVFGVSIASWVLPYLAVSRLFHAVVFGGAAGVFGLVCAALLSDLLLWDHGVCRSICPSGGVQKVLGRYRVLRLVALKGTKCQRSCNSCAQACWLGLDPRSGRVPDDCDGCARCAPVCPNTRLDLTFKMPKLSHVAKTLLIVALPTLMGCAKSHTPEVVSGEAPWSSPFMPPADPERTIPITLREWTVNGGAVEVGSAEVAADEVGLRLYLEEQPGKLWTGPLRVRIQNESGSTEVAFERANAPRSVPRPSMYEAVLRLSGPADLVFLDGPVQGFQVPLPRPSTTAPMQAALPPALVIGLWGIGLVVGRFRKTTDA